MSDAGDVGDVGDGGGIRLGCSSWSYHRTFEAGETTLLGWVAHCADGLGLDCLEIESGHFPGTSPAFLAELRQAIADHGLVLSDVTTFNDFGHVERADNEAQLDEVRRWVDVAAQLGSPHLRVFAGWPKGEREQQWGPMLEYLRRAAEFAAGRDVVLVLENHNHGGFVQTADDALRAIEGVGSPALRLNLDTGNYVDGIGSVERTIHLASHVHAKLMELDDEGRDLAVDHGRVLGWLRDAGYRGVLSAEYEGAEPEATAVPRGVAYLRRLLDGAAG